MTQWMEGKVIENRHWTETLFSLCVEGAPLSFEAGQFVRIALDIGGERVARPFSMVNTPDDPVLEFYGIVVPEGPLSPRLAQLDAGDTLYVAPNPAGFLVLSAPGLRLSSRFCGPKRRGGGSATWCWCTPCGMPGNWFTGMTSKDT